MKNIDRLFILTGLAFILAGMVLGLHMGASQDYTLRPVHAHLNLLGFTLMFLYGLAYHVWPRMKQGPLCVVHYGLHTVGTVVSMTTLTFLMKDPELGPTLGPVTDLMSALTTIGVLIFAYLFWTRGRA